MHINSEQVKNTKVVHIGIGAFHRSHQAYYFNKLIQNNHTKWGIIGINLRKQNADTIAQLHKHNNTYDLCTFSANGEEHIETIRSIKHTIDFTAPEHTHEALDVVSLENIELITTTVTESGYSVDDSFNLNVNADEIQNELKQDTPTTIYGYLRAALNLRMQRINLPITILCCDNLVTNGMLLQRCFMQYLELCNDTVLREWITRNVSFPNCLVDRITPQINLSGAHAKMPDNTIIAEDFHQWIIEDNFIAAKPPLDTVGAVFVPDAHPYETVKLSILNAGHSSICYSGALAGYQYFHEALADEQLSQFYSEVQQNETIPAINHNLPLDIFEYHNTVKKRFTNNHIKDLINRICLDGSNKMQIFILPTIVKCFNQQILPKQNIHIIAMWYIFMRTFAQGKLSFEYQDFNWQYIKPFTEEGKEHDFATLKFLWGEIPSKYPQFSTLLHNKIITLIEKYNV